MARTKKVVLTDEELAQRGTTREWVGYLSHWDVFHGRSIEDAILTLTHELDRHRSRFPEALNFHLSVDSDGDVSVYQERWETDQELASRLARERAEAEQEAKRKKAQAERRRRQALAAKQAEELHKAQKYELFMSLKKEFEPGGSSEG